MAKCQFASGLTLDQNPKLTERNSLIAHLIYQAIQIRKVGAICSALFAEDLVFSPIQVYFLRSKDHEKLLKLNWVARCPHKQEHLHSVVAKIDLFRLKTSSTQHFHLKRTLATSKASIS